MPNGVLQPVILAPVLRTGWSLALSDTPGDRVVATVIIWQYPCEDLVTMGR